jgi:hypothetical protein
VSNDSSTTDLQTGSTETDISASGLWNKSYVQRPDTVRLNQFALIAGMVLAITTSPATAGSDYWDRERPMVTWAYESAIGKRITLAEALQIADHILERAERERLQLVEWEAKRGIEWEEGG